MSLLERLESGEPVFTAWSSLPDELLSAALAQTSVDVVTLDMQHGGHHEDSILRGLGPLIASGKPGIVRVPVGRFDMASRALDFGADAVIAPMINTIDDARLFAASMKYPPMGERSWGASIAMARRGTSDAAAWLAGANAATMSFAMVETRQAYAILDDILAVPGIDGIFVGPSDLSIAWSGGAAVNPALEDMMEAVADIGSRVRAAGKHAGIYLVDMANAGRLFDMGYRLFAIGAEQRYLNAGAASLIASARQSIS